jgi:hypothetical protein
MGGAMEKAIRRQEQPSIMSAQHAFTIIHRVE